MTKFELRSVRLLEMLKTASRLDVSTVSDALEVSEATTRRLFARLEDEGKVLRLHGGVQLSPAVGNGYSYRLSANTQIREKTGIGRAAAELIESGDRVFLDSGTTVLRCAEALSIRLQVGELRDVVVLTNSLTYTGILALRCRVMLIGGEIRANRNDVCGSLAEKNLEGFHVDRAFFGADAISLEYGFMATDERTARMNEIIVSRADAFYVLADSSKFGRQSFVSYAPLSAVTELITDALLKPAFESELASAGVRFVTIDL